MTTTTTAVVTQLAGRNRLSLNDAQSYLATVQNALSGWYAGQSTDTHTYVSDGHEAIHIIDELVRELYAVRCALIDEIRADETERAARVDRLLAELRAERAGRTGTGDRDEPSGDASRQGDQTSGPGGGAA